MSSSPAFAATPRNTAASLATANTARDGTGTVATLFTAGSNGSRVDKIVVCATGTSTTAGVIRIFLHDGTNYFLFKEIIVAAVTPSTTIEAFRAVFSELILLPSGWSVRVSTNNAETFKVFAQGGDL